MSEGSFIKRNSSIIFIVLLALAIRLTFFILVKPWDDGVLHNKILVHDAIRYNYLGKSILDSKSFSAFSSFRTPGYPVYIALIYSIFGTRVWVVLLTHIFLDIGTVILVFLLAKKLFGNDSIAKIAAFLYSICILSVCMAMMLITEVLFLFILTLSILLFLKAIETWRIRNFVLVAFLVGLAALVKPVAKYVPVVMAVTLLFQREKGFSTLVRIVVLILVFLVTIAPWQARNFQKFGFYALSDIQGSMLFRYNVAFVKAFDEGKSVQEAEKELIGDAVEGIENPFERSKIYQRIAIKYISEHPFKFLYYHMKGCANLFLATPKYTVIYLLGLKSKPRYKFSVQEGFWERIKKSFMNSRNEYFLTPIFALKQFLEYLTFVIGLFVLYRMGKKQYCILLILIILYFTAVSGVAGQSRYRMPTVPFYLSLSAAGFYEAFKYIRRRVFGYF